MAIQFNRLIEIRIRADKHGRQRAHYWTVRSNRWLPLSLAAAELAIATGELHGCHAEAHVPYVAAQSDAA
jgi:hypothetical protein